MRCAKKVTPVVLATVLSLLLLTVAGETTAYAAEGDTDIGCYEYGYASSTPYAPPTDNYNPQLYGENVQRVYYISPEGSDTEGDGSINKPWATIGRGASEVTTAGSVLRLTAGRWVVNEGVLLAPGVSLEGAGASGASVSTITSTALVYLTSNVDNAIINLVSGSVVNGGQHISGIRFDGGDRTASQAIEIRGRNNVAVHDCVFVDFESMAVGWRTCSWQNITGSAAPAAIPSAWVKGGRFYNNTVTNCARYDSYARGALFCGGLEDFRIYNNVMTESNILNADGTIKTIRGVPIKFWYYDGWMLDCKIYDNTIHKLNSAASGNDGNGWPFAIESMCHYGMEICGNDVIGAIDLNYSMSGTYDGFKGFRAKGDDNAAVYDYATWIHDNSIHAQGEEGWSQNAVILEYDAEKTIIEGNEITDCASVLYFTPRGACVISDVTFRYNQCTDIRFHGQSDADAIRIDGWDAGFSISNLSIHNNLILCEGRGGFGIKLSHYGPYTGSNINISNNIISGFQWNPLLVQLHSSINGLAIQNNLFYGNIGFDGGDNDSTTGNITSTNKITNYVNSGNVELKEEQWRALFADAASGDYHLKKDSFAIDAGVHFSDTTDLDGNSVPYLGNTPTPLQYMITFNTKGGSSISSVTYTAGSTVNLADYTSTRQGYTFAGWYADKALTERITSVHLIKDIIIYAGWTEIEVDPGTANPFRDVTADDWFFEDVMFVFQRNLMLGVSDTFFDPYATTTRAMIATTIWRLEGKPVPESEKNPFTDVAKGQWYTDAILWVNENGIAQGYGDGLFGTNDPVTREQLGTIFYRYAQYKSYDTAITGSLSRFTDKNEVSKWAIGAMEWAVGYGLIQGKPGNVLDPQGNANRAEFGTMLHRFIAKNE